MNEKYNKNLVPNARKLRKNMTKEERKLWYDYLKNYPIRFRRQEIFGKYIVDFYCAKAKLVVELDGSQHFEDEGKANDEIRTKYLETYNVKVLRIANNELNQNFEGRV